DRVRRNRAADVVQRLGGAVPEAVGAGLEDGRMGGWADGPFLSRNAAHPPICPSAHRCRYAHPNRPVIYASVCSTFGLVKSSSVRPTSITLPRYMNAVKSETRAACCMLCVTI